LPLNYLDTWVQQIKKVTVQDIRTAMAAKLQPDNMVTIVLGATP
jgi:zinc protease